MQKRHLGVSWGLWTACLAAAVAAPPRALPPGPLEADDVFFEDARASLAGERESDPAAAQGDEDQVGDDDAPDWSAIITGDALADEVKRLALSLDEPLASQATFGAGGHVRCRDTFSLLSILFAVVAEHEEQPRWHADAPAVRDALADAAAACRAGDNQAYAAALAQRQQLDDLIRGARIAGPASPLGRWSELSERGPLMRRLQLAVDERIGPALTDLRTFNRSVEHLDHESQVIALLGAISCREEFEFGDDETFQDYSAELGQAADKLRGAAQRRDFEAARSAEAAVVRACAACHAGYRG
ncbi:MAG TPA: cytochrome c [Lacipirellulaceae bacterium]|nr:cytochrome c [Lacipirellulaceae bacterium]